MKGTVIKSTGSWYLVRAENGEQYRCRLRGKFKLKGLKVSNPIAVGDHVLFEIEDKGDGSAVISDIADRQNYIIRQSTHKSAHAHIIAANLDQAFLVVTLVSPRTSFGFIDRFLVTAEAYHIPAVLIFNKTDQNDEDLKNYQQQVMDMYQQIGYESLSCSAHTGKGLENVQEKMADKTTLFSGHSGVGKSTLINRLIPGLELKTSEISGYSDKGVHTTTFAEMFVVNDTTFIIDTPGIKELGVVDMPAAELGHYFPEMRALLGACRFHNCTHINEPGCAVREAVQKSEISLTRFESYLSIIQGGDNRK